MLPVHCTPCTALHIHYHVMHWYLHKCKVLCSEGEAAPVGYVSGNSFHCQLQISDVVSWCPCGNLLPLKAVSVPAADAADAPLQQPAPSSSPEVTTQGGLMAWVLWVPTVLCDMADVPQIWWPLVCHCSCHAGCHIAHSCMVDLRMSSLCVHIHVYVTQYHLI